MSIHTRRLFKRGERILVAVSGGMDSVVLLHALHTLASKFDWKLIVAHFNHQLRGRASDGDEQFVRQLGKSLRLRVVVGRGEVKKHAKCTGTSTEMAARELRHGFLARTDRRLNIHSVALAHHADDQVELFFLRLLRGAGGDGLAGMKWSSPSPVNPRIQLVRPLLDVSRAELEAFARANKIRFRLDASNVSRDFQRNRIRHELLPLLKTRLQPAIDKTVLRTMNIIADEAEFVASAAEQWLKRKRRLSFGNLPVAVQRRCLHTQLLHLCQPPDFDLIEKLRVSPGCPFCVSPGVSIMREKSGHISVRKHPVTIFSTDSFDVSLNDDAGEVVFDGVRCTWRVRRKTRSKPPERAKASECFDADKIGRSIVLRHWRAGDRFQPIGMNTAVKLQDWFQSESATNSQARVAGGRILVRRDFLGRGVADFGTF